MKRKKVGVIIIFIVILLIFSSIVIWSKLKEREEIKSESQSITREYLMTKYDITEEELENIDVNQVLKNFSWIRDGVDQKTTKEEVLWMLKFGQEELISNEASSKHYAEVSMNYLFGADEFTSKLPDFNTLIYFAQTREYETYSVSRLIDFEKSRYCEFTPADWVSSDYTQATKLVVLTKEHKQKIIQSLKDANLESWKHYYEDAKHKGDIYWRIGLEFEDGTIISYTGTPGDAGFPEQYDKLINYISNLFAGEPNTSDK